MAESGKSVGSFLAAIRSAWLLGSVECYLLQLPAQLFRSRSSTLIDSGSTSLESAFECLGHYLFSLSSNHSRY